MIYIKQGDLKPFVSATMKDADDVAIDLTGAAVQLRIYDYRLGQVILEKACTILDAAAGTVEYQWVAGETDTPGIYRFEFRITFADSKPLTVPNNGYDVLQIARKI